MTDHEHHGSAPSTLASACNGPAARCTMCREMANMRVVRSEDLLQGQRELFIVHAGQVYRLLHTRKDKLILQK